MSIDRGKALACLLTIPGLVAVTGVNANEEKVIYSFAGGSDGWLPRAPLAVDAFGNLYGTTQYGGAACDCGTVFKLTPDGKKTTLYKFAGGTGGEHPNGGLVLDNLGNLYGTTGQGDANLGVVFKVSPLAAASTGKEEVLHTFDGSDGADPEFGIVMVHNGDMYGTTSLRGQYGAGTAFRIAADGKFKLLHAFGTEGDGTWPTNFVREAGGTFYSTTSAGGPEDTGTVFTMANRGEVRVIYAFRSPGSADGFRPNGDLSEDDDGVLYGTTAYGGGANNEGTVFSLAPDGTEKVLHAFTGRSDGAEPSSALVRDGNRGFYGVTPEGGEYGFGTVFWVRK